MLPICGGYEDLLNPENNVTLGHSPKNFIFWVEQIFIFLHKWVVHCLLYQSIASTLLNEKIQLHCKASEVKLPVPFITSL